MAGETCRKRAATFDYVSPGSFARLCVVCHNPPVDPMVHTCGEWVCQLCIDKECPMCSEQLRDGSVPAVNKTLLTKLDAMEVYCPSCRGTQKRSQLPSHIQLCPIDCPNKCSTRVKPIDMNEHDTVCPMKPVRCLKCGAMIPRSRMTVDHIPHCPIECPLGCGALVAPIRQREHEEVCNMALIPCPGACLSCKWTGRRSEQTDHARSCAFAQMAPFIFSVINDCKSQVAALTQRVQSLEEQLHEKNASSSAPTSHTSCSTSILPQPATTQEAEGLRWNLGISGENAMITGDRVRRVQGFGACVVALDAPIPSPCTHCFQVLIMETDANWSGSISLMFCTQLPQKIPHDLRPGTLGRLEIKTRTADRFGISLEPESGCTILWHNGRDCGTLPDDYPVMPTDRPLFVMVDVYGEAKSIKLLPLEPLPP
ncbi:hypothetical protein Pelo_9023 [Pelomyxa schiedti]|nr:hypothetical protein Pelo_9023 [Pelomyxa schiedti]